MQAEVQEERAVSEGRGGLDEPDFAAFVATRSGALWRTAWMLCGDAHRAEDLVQTALLKTWRARARVESSYLEAYVQRVLFTTYCRSLRRRWTAEDPWGDVPDAATAPADVDGRLHLVDALRGLTRGQRAVVVCRYYLDLTERQTAEALGVGLGTVKSQHARAMKALRADLAEED